MKKQFKKYIFLTVSACILAACAVPVAEQKKKDGKGGKDVKAGQNVPGEEAKANPDTNPNAKADPAADSAKAQITDPLKDLQGRWRSECAPIAQAGDKDTAAITQAKAQQSFYRFEQASIYQYDVIFSGADCKREDQLSVSKYSVFYAKAEAIGEGQLKVTGLRPAEDENGAETPVEITMSLSGGKDKLTIGGKVYTPFEEEAKQDAAPPKPAETPKAAETPKSSDAAKNGATK
jgi:hypothetical protein